MAIQVLRFPQAENASYNPYAFPTRGQRATSALQNILGMVEQERQRNRERSIVEAILKGEEIPGINLPGSSPVAKTPGETIPLEATGQAPQRSLLGNILTDVSRGFGAMFDPTRAPAGITPVEGTIANAMLQSRLTPAERTPAGIDITGAYEAGREPPQGYEWGYDKTGKVILTKKEVGLPEGYKESLANAVQAIKEGRDPWEVYQKMAAVFPTKSAEIKRILIQSAKMGDLDISGLLWGDKKK
jgi:hypothetical protein